MKNIALIEKSDPEKISAPVMLIYVCFFNADVLKSILDRKTF